MRWSQYRIKRQDGRIIPVEVRPKIKGTGFTTLKGEQARQNKVRKVPVTLAGKERDDRLV